MDIRRDRCRKLDESRAWGYFSPDLRDFCAVVAVTSRSSFALPSSDRTRDWKSSYSPATPDVRMDRRGGQEPSSPAAEEHTSRAGLAYASLSGITGSHVTVKSRGGYDRVALEQSRFREDTVGKREPRSSQLSSAKSNRCWTAVRSVGAASPPTAAGAPASRRSRLPRNPCRDRYPPSTCR